MQRLDKYFGIYRGVVVNTNDPMGRNRITLKVPQVSGEEVTGWAWPINVIPENVAVPYGSFYDYTDQYAGSSTATAATTAGGALANTPIAMRLDTTDFTSTQYVSITGSKKTRITFNKAGLYNFQWSAQFENADNTSSQDISVWLRQNGSDLDGSTGLISLPQKHGGVNGHTIVGWNYFINATDGDYIELYWTASSEKVYIATYSAVTDTPIKGNSYPSTASVVATVDLVSGKVLPSSGDICWVMFEGGDPNFPLWLGQI